MTTGAPLAKRGCRGIKTLAATPSSPAAREGMRKKTPSKRGPNGGSSAPGRGAGLALTAGGGWTPASRAPRSRPGGSSCPVAAGSSLSPGGSSGVGRRCRAPAVPGRGGPVTTTSHEPSRNFTAPGSAPGTRTGFTSRSQATPSALVTGHGPGPVPKKTSRPPSLCMLPSQRSRETRVTSATRSNFKPSRLTAW